MKKLLMVAGISLLVLLVSGALVGVVLAEGPADGKAGIGQTFVSKVAKFLGIQEPQLKDAVKKAQLEMVDDAVKAGKLTEDQANRAKERIDKTGGLLGAPNIRQPKGRYDGKDVRHLFQLKAMADYLGMKPVDLATELRQGKTLAQIGQEHGKSRAELKTTIVSAIQKRVDEAVANGKMTQDQAKRAVEKANAEVDRLLDRSLKAPQGKLPAVADVQQAVAALADFLGIKPADLMAELRQGKTLAQIGQEHGKARDQLKTAIVSAAQKRVDAAVANGKLTQDQATKVMEKATAGIDNLLDRSFKGNEPGPKKGTSAS